MHFHILGRGGILSQALKPRTAGAEKEDGGV